MGNYIYIGLALLLAGMICLAGFRRASRESLYRYRNIAYVASLPAIVLMLVILGIEAVANGNDTISLLALLRRIPERFAQIAAVYILILCVMMAVSNVSLMRHEGLRLKNAVGTILYMIYLFGTVGIYILVRLFENLGWWSELSGGEPGILGRLIPLYLYVLLDYGECIMVGISVMGWLAAKQKPVYDKDFIIIPGCSISKGGGLLPLLRGRVNRAIRYAWQQEIECGKPVAFVPSGGQGADEVISEASAMELYLLSHAAEQQEIFPEKESKTTWENFVFSRKIIMREKPDAKVAFATTNYHMLRCGIYARKAGFRQIEGIASQTKWYFWPNGFAREVVAVLVMTKKYHIFVAGILFLVCMVLSRW